MPAASLVTFSRAPGVLDAFFAALARGAADGTGSAGAAGALLAVALAPPSVAATVIPAPVAMTPATRAAPPSLPGGTDQFVPPSAEVSGTPTPALARRTAHGPADDWATDVLTPADLSWDGEAAT
jgi:hypothetical protein